MTGSNLTFGVTAGADEFVLRRPPLGELPSTAHDMTREATVMSGLAASDVDGATVPAGFTQRRECPPRYSSG